MLAGQECLGPEFPVEYMTWLAADAVLREHGLYQYTPRGAFYLLVDIARSGMSSHAFALSLLSEQRVAVAPGDCFGGVSADHVRVSLAAAAADVETGLQRLCARLSRRAA